MDYVILVCSCERDMRRGCHEAILKTWGTWVPLRFLIGGTLDHDDDPILYVAVPDDYGSLARKVRHGVAWAYYSGYGAAIVCDIDTYIDVDRLEELLSDIPHYTGWRCNEGHAAGGHGYVLDRLAMDVVKNGESPGGWSDLWVGSTLQKARIECIHNPRFAPSADKWDKDSITVHLGRGTGNYDPQWMRDFHAKIA